MKKSLSLKTKTLILVCLLLLLATVPLVAYYLKAAEGLARLGTDPAIESSLSRSIDYSKDESEKTRAALALKKYRQIKVLKNRIVRQVVLFSAFYSGAVLLLALAVGYFFTAKITKPLRDLTAATQELARDQFKYKLEEKTGGEIGQLVSSFNKMADDLKTARQQRAIAERRSTWQRVARTIAHEIKNPLTPIKLSTERMYDKFLNESTDFPEVIKSTANTILNEIGNLQKLVDTFHKYAKFPDPVLQSEPINEIIEETVSMYKGNAVQIQSKLGHNIPLLSLDRGQVRQALTNLIKNGIEATQAVDRSGCVQVTSRQSDYYVFVTVQDNGCGISEENQKKLFHPYFTTKEHGNGIGLALTERILSLNGGNITFESKEDEGTKFTIMFKKEEA